MCSISIVASILIAIIWGTESLFKASLVTDSIYTVLQLYELFFLYISIMMIRKALKSVDAIKDYVNERVMIFQLVAFSLYFVSYLVKHSLTLASLYMKESERLTDKNSLRCKTALSEFAFNCWEKTMLIVILSIVLYMTTKYTTSAGIRKSKSFINRCDSLLLNSTNQAEKEQRLMAERLA